ncbi:hypothetical protein M0Q97_08630 [Candidatus Dojkabacteria bacterium]|jgi:hypothetical protein|nr:hypothetical protein [Candidatus Dojkabacteria bacterium]
MAAGKLYKDIPRMIFMIQVIEQYNNQLQLGAEEDIAWLKEKVNNLLEIKDTNKLITDFIECVDMINKYYDAIDPEWKKSIIKAIEKDRQD